MPAPKEVVLELKGNLDIRQAEEIHKSMLELTGGKKPVILDFAEAEDIDVSIIQLLYSFKTTLAGQKREVDFRNLNDRIISRITLCDFTSLIKEN
ncbi:MAG: STAS domain-containing protein [Spirochaetales bacterium]|nr:STAS domain-containing protein [Spirochaetales bacterium]